jgi:aminocarboxymuconate-semialdehyde decarboxylase
MSENTARGVKLDAYSHILPQPYFDLLGQIAPDKGAITRWLHIPILWDLEARLEMMEQFPGYQQILTLSSPPVETFTTPEQAPDIAALGNDLMADICERYPDRFPAWVASLPMNAPDAILAEVERALSMPGCCGVQVFTNVNGLPLDDPRFRPLFAEMASRDLPIWMHPARPASFSDYRTEDASRYEIWWTFGWPYETSAAMARLVFSGIMIDHPSLKVITHHMGAMVPYFDGRVGYGWDQLGSRTPGTELTDLLASLPNRPVDYFRRFYADTALSGSVAGTKCGLEFFGTDHTVFATDCPFDPEGGPMYIRETIEVLDALDVSEDVRRDIYYGNIRRIAGLDRAQTP